MTDCNYLGRRIGDFEISATTSSTFSSFVYVFVRTKDSMGDLALARELLLFFS